MKKYMLLLTALLAVTGCSNVKEISLKKGSGQLGEPSSLEVYAIRGEALFAPWQLIGSTEDFPGEVVPIPDPWNLTRESWPRGTGYGTYYLRLTPQAPTGPLSFYLPQVESAYKLWVNGELISQAGTLGEDRETIKPGIFLFDFVTVPPAEEYSILLQAANADHNQGGLHQPLLVGTPNALGRYLGGYLAREFLVLTLALFMGLYHLLFFMMRPREKGHLYFALLALFLAARMSFSNISLLQYFIDISWTHSLKLRYIATFLLTTWGFLYFYHLLQEDYSRTVMKVQLSGGLIYSVIPVFVSPHTLLNLLVSFEVFAVINILYIFRSLNRALKRQKEGTAILIVTLIPVVATVIMDGLTDINLALFPPMTTAGLMFLIAGQSVIQTRKFFRLMKDTENQNQELMEIESTILAQNKKLNQMAHYDDLTGLPNRISLSKVFHAELQRAKRSQTMLAVFFMDLNNFKQVNDNYGHDTGDALLKEFANRFSQQIRATDSFFRLAGDEFILLFNDVNNPNQLKSIAQKITTLFDKPFLVNGDQIETSVSAGVSLYPQDGESADQLIQKADYAMYRQKKKKEGGVSFYDPQQDRVINDKNFSLSVIQQAITEGQFLLHYQPMIQVKSGKLWGMEVLVRWNHPQKGLLYPGSFLPMMESTGLILSLGTWIMDHSFRQLAEWRKKGMKVPQISLNLSTHQFGQPGIANLLDRYLKKHNLTPKDLLIEITESTLLSSRENGLRQLERLQEMDLNIAIDHFGSEFFNLQYLKNYPLSAVKIGKEFIQSIEINQNDQKILESLISLGRATNLDIIIEGIERKSQRNFFNEKDLIAQGFAIAKPLEAKELEPLMEGDFS